MTATKPGGCLQPTTLKKLKSVAGHIGLLATLMIYTFIGGIVSNFQLKNNLYTRSRRENFI